MNKLETWSLNSQLAGGQAGGARIDSLLSFATTDPKPFVCAKSTLNRRAGSKAQSGARYILRSGLDSDVVRAHFLEAFTHGVDRTFGLIAIAAQVAEIQMAQPSGDDLLNNPRGVLVREMAVPAQDALLDAPRPLGVFLKELQVVVGFQQQHVRGADAFHDEFCGVAEVGQKANVSRARADQEPNRIVCVMRDGESVHDDVSHFKRRASAEDPAIESGIELVLNGLLGETVAEDWNLKFRAQGCQTLNVITVFMGDENATQQLRRSPDGGKPLSDLTSAQTGVDEQPRLVGFEVSAIARGAATQDRQFDWHAPTLG